MAEVAGSSGSVSFTSFSTSVKSFSLSWNSDVEDITSFDDSDYKTYLPTLKDWTATLEMNWDVANSATPGSSGTLYALPHNSNKHRSCPCCRPSLQRRNDYPPGGQWLACIQQTVFL